MKKVVIYSSDSCGYCHAAKDLLRSKGVDFEEVRVDGNPDKRREALQRSGRRTVPQIFVGEQLLGGFDDINALERRGELDRILAD